MKIADKTNFVLLGNLTNEIQGHAFIYGYALRSTAGHLTDDPSALSSSPETGGLTGSMDNLPRGLQVGDNILAKILRFQHRSWCVVDRNNITANDLGIDACRDGADPASVSKKLGSDSRITKEVCEQGQAAQIISNGARASRYAHKRH